MKKLLLAFAVFTFLCGDTLEELEIQKKLLENKIQEERLKQEQKRLQLKQEQLKQEQELQAQTPASQNTLDKDDQNKSHSRSGFLFGIGLGGLSSFYQTPSTSEIIKSKSMLSLMFNLQLGQSWMLNDYFGIQHYADLEVNYGHHKPWQVISLVTTYNLDMIISAINNPQWGNALIFGIGGGGKISGFSLEPDTQSTRRGSLEARVNVGIRTMIARKYAIDFMMRFPLFMQESGYYYRNTLGEKKFLKYKDVISFGVNFTLATF